MDRLRPVHPQWRRDGPGRRRRRLAPPGPARPRRHPACRRSRACSATSSARRSGSTWPQALVVLAVVVTLLAVGGYVLSFWGYRLTRHLAGTLHVTRGLLTTRATSIEERRLRGVEIGEPVPLRWVGGRRLSAITTGLRSRNDNGGGSAMLVPPAPLGEVARVAGLVLGDPAVRHRARCARTVRRPAADGWCAPPCRPLAVLVAAGVVQQVADLPVWVLPSPPCRCCSPYRWGWTATAASGTPSAGATW